MKLYEINSEIMRLYDSIEVDEETGELLGDAEELLDQIHSLEMEKHSILEWLAKLILNIRLDCLKYIRQLKEKNIPVRLLNALQPSASGTLISNTAEKEAIKAVAAKDNITYVKIKSLHTIPTPHFLSIVFDTFYNYNTPVDMVTTSDIGVSVAIDNDKHIDEIVGVLREYATITVEKNMVIVCVVGDLEWQNVGFEARIINALKDIPVRMISYGGSSSNVSLVMKAEDKVHALKALSEHLFSVSDIY